MVGKKAPAFTLADQNNEKHKLSDYSGQWVVLYFYPKDSTPGCTNEAIDFTELLPKFKSRKAVVLGCSPDSTQSHQKFTDKYDLKVTLLSDPEKTAHKKYGAWGLKKNYGKEYEGVIRSTFLISPEGKVAEAWSNVKVRKKLKSGEVKHAEEVLKKLDEFR